MVPVLLSLTFVNHTSVRWGYMAAAVACIAASIAYQGVYTLVTRGESSMTSQANSWFIIACLALAGLACIELSTATPAALYTPAMLVGVIFVSIVGDRRMQLVVDMYALALIALIGWVQGLRGGEFVVSMVIYASTIAVVNFICARTVGSLTGQINFSQALDSLNDCFDEVDIDGSSPTSETFAQIFSRGLPYVACILPAERVAVFNRNRSLDRFTLVASWPDLSADCGDLTRVSVAAKALLLRPARRLRRRWRTHHGDRADAARSPERSTHRRGGWPVGRLVPAYHQPGQLRHRPPHRKPD